MAKAPTLYVPVSVRMVTDKAIIKAGPMAELLYIRGLAFSKQNERDGELLSEDLPLFARGIPKPYEVASRLVANGLWLASGDGWVIRSWAAWNLGPDELADLRDVRKKAAKAGNHARYEHEGDVEECPICNKEKVRI